MVGWTDITGYEGWKDGYNRIERLEGRIEKAKKVRRTDRTG